MGGTFFSWLHKFHCYTLNLCPWTPTDQFLLICIKNKLKFGAAREFLSECWREMSSKQHLEALQSQNIFSQNKNKLNFCQNSAASLWSSQVVSAHCLSESRGNDPVLCSPCSHPGGADPCSHPGTICSQSGLCPPCQAGTSLPRNKQQPPFSLTSIKT